MPPATLSIQFRLRLLFFPLVMLLLPAPAAALEETAGPEPDNAPRIGLLAVEEEDFSAREAAFFTRLGELYGLEQPPAAAADVRLVCAANEARPKAALLMERNDLDLVLAADPKALKALAAEHNGRTPVLAFSPFCIVAVLWPEPDMTVETGPEDRARTKADDGADDAAQSKAGDRKSAPAQAEPDNASTPPSPARPELFFLFPEDFLSLRLSLLQQLTGFKRLGFIAPAKNAGEKARLEALALENAAALIAGKMLELYVFADMARPDEENCREALDSLFFDQVDALILDGSGCFTPKAPHFGDLLRLAQSRGMLPISLADPNIYRHGALLSPFSGDEERLGRFLAARALDIMDAALEGEDAGTEFAESNEDAGKAKDANKTGRPEKPAPAPRLLPLPGWQPYFSLNLAVAADMAFEPSAGLLALTRSYLGLPAPGEPASKPEAPPATKEHVP